MSPLRVPTTDIVRRRYCLWENDGGRSHFCRDATAVFRIPGWPLTNFSANIIVRSVNTEGAVWSSGQSRQRGSEVLTTPHSAITTFGGVHWLTGTVFVHITPLCWQYAKVFYSRISPPRVLLLPGWLTLTRSFVNSASISENSIPSQPLAAIKSTVTGRYSG